MEKMNSPIEPARHDAEPAAVIAPEPSPKATPAVAAAVPAAVALSGEQQKRLDLLNEYQEHTHAPRAARNAAIDTHATEWRERWLQLQGEIEQARATRVEQLARDGTPGAHHPALLAKESADRIERFEADKDAAVRKLVEGLPQPIQWLDFLKDQAQENPADLTLASLIEEAEQSPGAGVEGLGGTQPKAITLADLVHSVDKDGTLNYKRGLATVIRDSGTRLDVKRLDNRDIEAALKIAAQKFDLQPGLILTGDAAFKPRAAEIAGRLGLPLQNSEPEVLMAWQRGREQTPEHNPGLRRTAVPSVERGITGDLAVPRQLGELSGPVPLRADPHTLDHAAAIGLVPNGAGGVNLSGERLLAANAIIRETPLATLRTLARVDLARADGGLESEAQDALQQAGLTDAAGNLTQAAQDAVVVRDDRVMRKRDVLPPHLNEVLGVAYRTSGEYVREAESLKEFERVQNLEQQRAAEQQKASEQHEADQKALRVRNVDDDLEQSDQDIEHTHEAIVARTEEHEAHPLEIEAKAIQRPGRARTRAQSIDVGQGL